MRRVVRRLSANTFASITLLVIMVEQSTGHAQRCELSRKKRIMMEFRMNSSLAHWWPNLSDAAIPRVARTTLVLGVGCALFAQAGVSLAERQAAELNFSSCIAGCTAGHHFCCRAHQSSAPPFRSRDSPLLSLKLRDQPCSSLRDTNVGGSAIRTCDCAV